MPTIPSIQPQELKETIDSGADVTIVDVRGPADFDEWHIDGENVEAVNVPLTQLQTVNPAELLNGASEGEVVAVCASGQTSQMAVQMLQQSGIDAKNLQYGMNGWANLYVYQELETEASATILQFSRPSSGCLAYMVVSDDEAVVVDPLLAFVDQYIEVAREYGAEITAAVDTHVHADHISGVRAFATRSSADVVVPEPAVARGIDYAVDYETVAHGDVIAVGDSTIDVVHTPGHTSGMTSFLVDESVLLSGDGLFTESVARPDLEDGDEGAADAAATLYDSLHERILTLDDGTVVAPAHYSDSADPADDGSYTATLGDLKSKMDALSMPESEFVEYITADVPPRPSNHEQIIQTNLGQIDTPNYVAFQLELGPNNCAASQESMTQ
ncbi:MBL fold metallo-hydrolase [Haloferax sp. YSSS75]|uniref:MBL fold metallo-hydrolase n=1 Tax=Haloferax sp. YSSS75 TaxID=3388564 RepID=UPI00398D1DB1